MSVYFEKGRGWRYDFVMDKRRYRSQIFNTKQEARQAEARRREDIAEARREPPMTDMAFFELVNRRLDHVKAYNSQGYYQDHVYKARMWVKLWGGVMCGDITRDMVERFLLERRGSSAELANVDLRYMRATFRFGLRRGLILNDPTKGICSFPVERKVRYVPEQSDIDKVMEVADQATRDYLCVIRETMGRMGEINRLRWEDINLGENYVLLYTRKKRGGHLTPRKVPMTSRLKECLERMQRDRDTSKPWVFWHRYVSSKTGEVCEGPYHDRKKFMRRLCRKAGVRYFRFHALRHSGASLLDKNNVPIGSIQKILGHENRTTTEIYLNGFSGDTAEAMRVFDTVR